MELILIFIILTKYKLFLNYFPNKITLYKFLITTLFDKLKVLKLNIRGIFMNKKVLVTVGVIVLVILLGSVGFLIYKLNDANKEREDILEQFSYEREQMEQNKSQLEQDYVTLSNDLEGFSLKVNNDSILKKLNDEQKRVQLLLEELRTTKATNVKRITY